MTDKQKQAILLLNNLKLNDEEYFLLLEFIVEQPTQVWSPTWTQPQPIEPFYKVTCTDNDKFRNVFKDIPVHKVLHPDNANKVENKNYNPNDCLQGNTTVTNADYSQFKYDTVKPFYNPLNDK